MIIKFLKRLYFGEIGKYVRASYKNKSSEKPMSIMKEYSLNEFYDITKTIEHGTKSKKALFIWEILKKKPLIFCSYVLALIAVMIMGNIAPLIFEQLLHIWKPFKENGFFIYCIIAFICFQIVYSLIKNHSVHLKWKLITAIDHNTKNYIVRKFLTLRKKQEIDKGEFLNLYTLHSYNMRGIIELLEFIVNASGIIIGIVIIMRLLGVGGLIGSIFFLGLVVVLSKSVFILDKFDVKIFKKNGRRIKIISEVLEKYKDVRLNNFEAYCYDKIKIVRDEQLDEVKKKNHVSLLFSVAESCLISLLIAFSIIISIVFDHEKIDPVNILSAFLAFNFLEKTIKQFFMSLDSTRICMKSLDYILEFLSEKKINETDEDEKVNNPFISLKNVSFEVDGKSIINNINFEVKNKRIITISGGHASGKTTLLDVMSKKIIPQSGTVDVIGKLSYIKKEGWFLDASIRDNIILGKEFNENKYSTALALTCLNEELFKFDNQDNCIVTNGGKNLSGGQSIRIQLARAIYQDSDIILFDDVLNSIDIDSRNFIIQNFIKKFGNDKIFLIVTNDRMLIDIADEHFCMEYGNLISNKYIVLNKPIEKLKGEYHKANRKSINTVSTSLDESPKNTRDILKQYLGCIATKKMLLLFVLLFVSVQITDFFLKFFVSEYKTFNLTSMQFIGIYLGLVLFSSIVNFMRYHIVYHGNLNAGRIYHERLVKNILNSHYEKVDNNFIKKVLSTVSRDINILDTNIADYFVNVFDAVIYISGTILIMLSSNILSAIASIIFIIVFIRAQKESRKVTNIVLERSNYFKDHCTGVLNNIYNGIYEIDALGIKEYITKMWELALENAYNYEYTRQAINRYELQKIDFAAYGMLGVFMILTWKFNINSGLIAVVSMYLLTMISEFENMLRNIRHAEIGIESLKRMESMSQYNMETMQKKTYRDISNREYDIIFDNVSSSYVPGQYIFDKICFNIRRGERVLIQGASGIGKTTLFNCLENLIGYDGNIYFCGINIQNISIKELRNKICVITQENFILDESLSDNLDPYNRYTYEEKISALKSVGWDVSDLQKKCSNLSKSERLFVSLARVCLKKPDVLLLDESISNVDEETWKIINTLIKTKFKDKTVLSISHNTDEKIYTRKIVLW